MNKELPKIIKNSIYGKFPNQSFRANLIPERNYSNLEQLKEDWEKGWNFILQSKGHILNGLLVHKNLFKKEDIFFLYNNKHKRKHIIVFGGLK